MFKYKRLVGRFFVWLELAVVVSLLAGCGVSRSEYDKLKDENLKLQQQVSEMRLKVEESKAGLADCFTPQELAAIEADCKRLQEKVNKTGALQNRVADLEGKLQAVRDKTKADVSGIRNDLINKFKSI